METPAHDGNTMDHEANRDRKTTAKKFQISTTLSTTLKTGWRPVAYVVWRLPAAAYSHTEQVFYR